MGWDRTPRPISDFEEEGVSGDILKFQFARLPVMPPGELIAWREQTRRRECRYPASRISPTTGCATGDAGRVGAVESDHLAEIIYGLRSEPRSSELPFMKSVAARLTIGS